MTNEYSAFLPSAGGRTAQKTSFSVRPKNIENQLGKVFTKSWLSNRKTFNGKQSRIGFSNLTHFISKRLFEDVARMIVLGYGECASIELEICYCFSSALCRSLLSAAPVNVHIISLISNVCVAIYYKLWVAALP